MENINAALASGDQGQASLALDLSQAKKKAKRRVVAVKTGMMTTKMMILTLMMTMMRMKENKRKVLPNNCHYFHRLWDSRKVKKTTVMKMRMTLRKTRKERLPSHSSSSPPHRYIGHICYTDLASIDASQLNIALQVTDRRLVEGTIRAYNH